MGADKKPLPLADLIGRWQFVAVYGVLYGAWVKGRTIKPGSIVWEFRDDGTLVQYETGGGKRIVSFSYDDKTGAMTVGPTRDHYFLFADDAGGMELFDMEGICEIERCRIRQKFRRQECVYPEKEESKDNPL